jgi:glycerol dehydrogenase-like iron-containing ADH family enzyme
MKLTQQEHQRQLDDLLRKHHEDAARLLADLGIAEDDPKAVIACAHLSRKYGRSHRAMEWRYKRSVCKNWARQSYANYKKHYRRGCHANG